MKAFKDKPESAEEQNNEHSLNPRIFQNNLAVYRVGRPWWQSWVRCMSQEVHGSNLFSTMSSLGVINQAAILSVAW